MAAIMSKAERDNRRWYARRIKALYAEAKARHDGMSLTIYGDVSAMLDRLDGTAPQDGDLYKVLADADALCGRLRVA